MSYFNDGSKTALRTVALTRLARACTREVIAELEMLRGDPGHWVLG